METSQVLKISPVSAKKDESWRIWFQIQLLHQTSSIPYSCTFIFVKRNSTHCQRESFKVLQKHHLIVYCSSRRQSHWPKQAFRTRKVVANPEHSKTPCLWLWSFSSISKYFQFRKNAIQTLSKFHEKWAIQNLGNQSYICTMSQPRFHDHSMECQACH